MPAGDPMVRYDQGLLKKQCPLYIRDRSQLGDFGDVADVDDVAEKLSSTSAGSKVDIDESVS